MRERCEQLPLWCARSTTCWRGWSATNYVYKILPYPVNLKQEGEKDRPARSARDRQDLRNRRDTKTEVLGLKLQIPQLLTRLTSLAFVRPGQPEQFHRLLGSGASFGGRVEKLSWVGVDADIRYTAALPDHFIEGSRSIAPMGGRH